MVKENPEITESNAAEQERLSKWLDGIQEDSWQLELLVSGFAIFLLIGAIPPVVEYEFDLMVLSTESNYSLLLANLYYPARSALYMLVICLIGHVLLRGLWIAAIGLRYVSGGIDYEELKYQSRFRTFLRGRIGDFDHYIGRLERACSVAFAVSFLIIFAIISLSSFIFLIACLQIGWEFLVGGALNSDSLISGDDIFGLVVLLAGLIYFIDFASLGFFKRKKWAQRWYYPIYRVVGWLTLARIYRPLYHNLIDNRFGRRLGRMLPLVLILSLLAISIRYVRYAYLPVNSYSGSTIRMDSYDDLKHEPDWISVWNVSLDSRYVGEDNYLEIFVPYLPRNQDGVIKKLYPDLETGRFAGIKIHGAITLNQVANFDSNADSLLTALSSLHQVYIDDSLLTDVSWRFYDHPDRRQSGLLYMYPAHELPTGEHQLNIKRQWINEARDSLYWSGANRINFYR